MNKSVVIIGGDLRQKYLYYHMLNNGFAVTPYDIPEVAGIENLPKSEFFDNFIKSGDVFILPVPFSRDKITINSKSSDIIIDELLSYIKPGSIVAGGCFTESFRAKCKDKEIKIFDLMDLPSFELLNSIATAEGAILEAISKSPLNIHMSDCLVLGYGKCGSAIAKRLSALGANVTVCARNNLQQMQAFECGHKYIDFDVLAEQIDQFEFIFNSVPAMVLTKDLLRHVKEDAVIIDIASKPGGTDFKECEKLGIAAYLCLSLPGKYSPKSSAGIIYNCILEKIK